MKKFQVLFYYNFTVRHVISANSEEEAQEIAEARENDPKDNSGVRSDCDTLEDVTVEETDDD